MGNQIKVDPESYFEQSRKFEEALSTFKPFLTSFISLARGELDGFNSDFIDSFKSALKNLADDTDTTLFSELENYSKEIKTLGDEFLITDGNLADGIEGRS